MLLPENSLSDVQQVCQNLLSLHVPSKVSIERKIERLSVIPDLHLLAPFSLSEGRGCNFRLLVKELQIFGEADKSLLIDSLASCSQFWRCWH